MARFEPSRPGPPPRPGSPGPRPDHHEHHDLDDRLGQAERIADGVRDVAGRRLLPRLRVRRLIPGFVRRRLPELPPEAQHRLTVVSGFAQTIGLIIGGTLAVALLFQAITRQALIEPGSAKEVLEHVKDPDAVAYSVETIRVKKIDGALLRQDSIRGIEVRPGQRKFRASVSGVTDSSLRMTGDGKITLLQFQDRPAQVITPNPSRDQLRPVYGSDLEPVAGKITSAKATVAGERGWLLTWKPTAKLLLRLLNASLLELQTEDIRAIAAGRFRIRYANATVVRSSRRLYQMDTVVLVNGAQLRILATYRQQNGDILTDFTLQEDPDEQPVS